MAKQKMIVICGVDGCGKTSMTQALQSQLTQRGVACRVLWSRFRNYFSKPLLALARLTGHNRRFFRHGEWLSHHDFSALPVFREIFVILQMLDVNLGAYWYISRARKKHNGIVLCERGPWDTLVDVVADTGAEWLLKSWLAKLFVYQMRDANMVIFINRDPHRIFISRPALCDDPTLTMRAELYMRLAEMHGWCIVNNNGELTDAIEKLSSIADDCIK